MLTIEEDFSRVGGGYANLWIAGQKPDGPVKLRIRRLATEPYHLGPNGWQVQEADLPVQEAGQDGANVQLLVGPEICDHILEDTEVEIKVPVLDLRQVIIWPYVAPAVDREKRSGFVPGVSEPVEETIDDQVENAVPPDRGPTESGGKDDQGGDDIGPVDPEESDEQETKSGWKIWAVVAVIALIAAVAIYFMVVDKTDTLDTEPPDEVSDTAGTEEVPDTAEAEEVPDTAEAEEVLDTTEMLLDEARACQDSGCSGEDFFALTERFEAIEDYDNALRLADIAASNGSHAGDLWIARLYDPLLFKELPGGPSEANSERALQKYQSAIEGDLEGAQEDFENLCAAVSERSETDAGGLTALEQAEAARLAEAYCDD